MKKLITIMILGLVFLSGCGQKGPLFIPGLETDADQATKGEKTVDSPDLESDEELEEDNTSED